jgi:hypothetical protein
MYFKDGQAPVQVLGYPRLTSRLHLDDHKLLLGTHHIEHDLQMEYFNPDVHRWVAIQWDSPILVDGVGATILFKVKGVRDLKHWDIHVGVALGAGSSTMGTAKANKIQRR